MFAGTMVVNVLAYLYHVVVGRVLGPEKYGEFAALFSIIFILGVPAQVIQTILTNYFSVYNAKGELSTTRYLFTKAVWWILVFCCVGVVIYLLIIPMLMDFLKINSWWGFFWIWIICATFILSTVIVSLLNGYQKFIVSNTVSAIGMLLRVISGAVGAFISVSAVVFGAAIAGVVSLLVVIPFIRFIFTVPPNKNSLKFKQVAGYGVPTMVGILAITSIYTTDILLAKHFLLANEAGVYAALSLFGKIVFFLSSPILLALFPTITKYRASGAPYMPLLYKGLAVVAVLSGSVVVAYNVIGDLLASLLFGPRFAGVAPYLAHYGLFMALIAMSNYIMMVCLATRRFLASFIVLVAALAQIILIHVFHQSISNIILSNLCISCALFIVLLIYLRYAKEYAD